jgi:hypothetical protein
MKTAAEFAHAAAQMSRAAAQMKPDDSDPYPHTRKLIQYHLQVAAKNTRELAEALAKEEDACAPSK